MNRALAAPLLVILALAARAELTPEESRGRGIYRTGESASGTPIVALVGPEDLEVPATSLPCMSCHGGDGRGKEEGGVRPSNLQWHALTKPYRVVESSGRSRPPYTPALLKRAVTMGTDSGRNKLNPVMPRYRMTMRDADDLVAYLARLGTDTDPGLRDDEILIGTMLPRTAEGEAIRQALTRHFDAINTTGGIFGRHIRLGDADAAEEPFAIVAAQLPGREQEIGAMAAAKHIPTIAAYSARVDDLNRYLIHVLPTIEEQSRALIGGQKVRIIHDAGNADIAARLSSHHSADASTVLFLSTPTALETLLASNTAGTILVPAAFASDALFSAPPSTRVLIALPTTRPPRDIALAAAALITRALADAGRDLDRETVVDLMKKAIRSGKSTILRVEDGQLVKVD